MKTLLLILAACIVAASAFPQATINFSNRAGIGQNPDFSPGVVLAPIYGVDPANPYQQQIGQTASGIPAGSTVYNGAPLTGTGFTATLWERNSTDAVGTAAANNLALIATTTFRTLTSQTFLGTVMQPPTPSIVPDVSRPDQRGAFQVRVWNNQGGIITTWDQALAAWTVGATAIGWSDIFTVPFPLGNTEQPPNIPANLVGLTSFQLFLNDTSVPEPSVIAFGLLAAGSALVLCKRSKPGARLSVLPFF
jgi:hypothetical protein